MDICRGQGGQLVYRLQNLPQHKKNNTSEIQQTWVKWQQMKKTTTTNGNKKFNCSKTDQRTLLYKCTSTLTSASHTLFTAALWQFQCLCHLYKPSTELLFWKYSLGFKRAHIIDGEKCLDIYNKGQTPL